MPDTQVRFLMRMPEVNFSHHILISIHHPIIEGWTFHLRSPYFEELFECMVSLHDPRVYLRSWKATLQVGRLRHPQLWRQSFPLHITSPVDGDRSKAEERHTNLSPFISLLLELGTATFVTPEVTLRQMDALPPGFFSL